MRRREFIARLGGTIFALPLAALALAGCNANQGVNLSSPTAPGVVAGPDFPNYNAYDPTKYGQTSGIYAGGSGGR